MVFRGGNRMLGIVAACALALVGVFTLGRTMFPAPDAGAPITGELQHPRPTLPGVESRLRLAEMLARGNEGTMQMHEVRKPDVGEQKGEEFRERRRRSLKLQLPFDLHDLQQQFSTDVLSSLLAVASEEQEAQPEAFVHLPVRRCGYNNLPLASWQNPINWNRTAIYEGIPPVNVRTPIFVVGCGHSGTTYLVSVLGKHPSIYLTFFNDLNRESPLCVKQEHIDVFPDWVQFAKEEGKTHIVAKAPSNICCMGHILGRIPQGRVIVLIRDGRDVVKSLAKRYEDYPGADANFLISRWINDNIIALSYAHDPRFILVKYEDLVSAPVELLAEIFDFVGAPTDKRTIADFVGLESPDAKAKAKPTLPSSGRKGREHDELRDWQTRQAIYNDTQRWKTEGLSEELRAGFKASPIALALLHLFGYSNTLDGSDW